MYLRGRAHVGSSHIGEHTESVYERQGLDCLVGFAPVYNKKETICEVKYSWILVSNLRSTSPSMSSQMLQAWIARSNPNCRLVACELPWYWMDIETSSVVILWNGAHVIAKAE